MGAAMPHLLRPRRARPLALLAFLALASACPAGAMGAAGGTAGTPPSSGTGTGTTTYVPAGGATPAPSAVPSGSASATPTVSSAPTVGAGSLSAGHPSGQAATPSGGPTAARPGKKHLSGAAIAIAALAALLALGCAVWGLARRRAFEPHWWLSLRHAIAEAGFRASATWAEFTDWVRLGH